MNVLDKIEDKYAEMRLHNKPLQNCKDCIAGVECIFIEILVEEVATTEIVTQESESKEE